MNFSRLSPLYLLCFSLLLLTVNGSDPLFHFCSPSKNYTAKAPFGNNLRLLMGSLSIKVPITGFGLGSFGLGLDRVNALALCRGDVSRSECKTCIADASIEIRKLCPSKEAIIWFDYCLFRYSNDEIFGKIDYENKFYMWNTRNVTDPTLFNQKVGELLNSLSLEAYQSPKMFATGELEFGESEKLYGLTQCTRDLSSDDCKKCLDGAISELPTCCSGQRGGRVVGGSCNVRYELYPFVHA